MKMNLKKKNATTIVLTLCFLLWCGLAFAAPPALIQCAKVHRKGEIYLSTGEFFSADQFQYTQDKDVRLPDGKVVPVCQRSECAVVNPDGSVIFLRNWPEESISMPGQYRLPVILAEDIVASASDVVKYPDGTILLPGGKVSPVCQPRSCASVQADGSVIVPPNRNAVPASDVVKNPDGTIGLPGGKVLPACPPRQDQSNLCVVINTDGSLRFPDGTVVSSDRIFEETKARYDAAQGMKSYNYNPSDSAIPTRYLAVRNYPIVNSYELRGGGMFLVCSEECVQINPYPYGPVGLPGGKVVPASDVVKNPNGTIGLPDGKVLPVCRPVENQRAW